MEDDKDIFPKEMSRQPFTLPDNYFDDFSAKMDSIIAEQSDSRKVVVPHVNSHRLFASVISSAAVFIGLVVCGYFLLNMQKDVELEAERIIAQENYMDEMIDMVDIDYLEEVLADAEFCNFD